MDMEAVKSAIPPSVMAIFGGVVSGISGKGEFSPWAFLTGVVTAAFVGIVLHLMLLDWGVGENTRMAAVAIGGYSANDVLYALRKLLLARLHKAGLAQPTGSQEEGR